MQPEGLTTTGFDQDDFVMIPYTTAMKNGWRIFLLRPFLLKQLHRQLTKSAGCFPNGITCAPKNQKISRFPALRTLKAQEEASHIFALMLASIASV